MILLDAQMPGMDGFETAEHIKRRERTRHVPILFLTAVDYDPHLAFRGYQAGAVDYITKPFDPWVLRAKVSVFVDRGCPPSPPRPPGRGRGPRRAGAPPPPRRGGRSDTAAGGPPPRAGGRAPARPPPRRAPRGGGAPPPRAAEHHNRTPRPPRGGRGAPPRAAAARAPPPPPRPAGGRSRAR